MFPYDPDFSPPAPVLEITVHHPKTADLKTGVRAQLDPGSDISVLPESADHAIRLQHDGELEVEGYDGLVARALLCVVKLEVAGEMLPPMSVVVMPRSHAILGRDVLNHFTLTLSGKDLSFRLEDP
ncbi:MAG: hypothetical protein E3J21_01720 [Anaerolineales bacterium]|nr:MAG: hypothetical protein E3J21_01720 [Anaerolineales bacterium]